MSKAPGEAAALISRSSSGWSVGAWCAERTFVFCRMEIWPAPSEEKGAVDALSQTGDARRLVADGVDPGWLAVADSLRLTRQAKGGGSWPPGSPSGEPLKASTAAGIQGCFAMDVNPLG